MLGVFDMKFSPTVAYSVIAPWKIISPEVDWYLLEIKRKEEDADFLGLFYVTEVYINFTQVYTDGIRTRRQE